MVINENNSHINSFTKGMNSDTAYDQIQNVQYTYGKNIRITKNQMLGGASDYSTIHEGIIAPIPSGVVIGNKIKDVPIHEVLATGSIDEISVIVCAVDDKIVVYKISVTANPIDVDTVWECPGYFTKDKKDVSIVLYKELENVTKLYIATGETPIITLNLDKPKHFYEDREVDYLINNRIMPKDPVYIDAVIDGRLITSQVQYTYRFYNKYGNSTQLAPLTNKIQVISPVRDKEVGNAENTETSIGFTIKIPVAGYTTKFDRMQVFRLSFIKPNEDSEIALIYDDKIKGTDSTPFVLNDVGIEPLQVLTIEEFAAMSGLILKPRSIETNQQYMFCSNVEDDTIITDLRLTGVNENSTIPQVYTQIILSDTIDGTVPSVAENNFSSSDTIRGTSVNIKVNDYFKNRGVNPDLAKSSYNNIFTSSLLRSLRRGETYKYGIVFYDSKGRRSDVLPIGKASILSIKDDNRLTFGIQSNKLVAYPIGVNITLPQPKDKYGKLYPDIVGCQVVRRSSSELYQKSLLQVALARPIQQGLMYTNEDWNSENKSPFYPSGFLTTNDLTIMPPYYINAIAFDTVNRYIRLITDDVSYTTEGETVYQNFSGGRYLLSGNGLSSDAGAWLIPVVSLQGHSYASIQNISNLDYDELYVRGADLNEYRIPDPSNVNIQDSFFSIEPINGEYYYLVPKRTVNTIYHEYVNVFGKLIRFVFSVSSGSSSTIPGSENRYEKFNATTRNERLFQIFSSEIDFRRDDVLDKLNTSDAKIEECFYAKPSYKRYGDLNIPDWQLKSDYAGKYEWETGLRFFGILNYLSEGINTIFHRDTSYKLSTSEKNNIHWVFNYFQPDIDKLNDPINIKQIKDVKIPGWNDGYTNVQRDGENHVIDAIKKYKQYTTNIDQYVYNNWISMGKYDIKVSSSISEANQTNMDPDTGEFLNKPEYAHLYKYDTGWNKTESDFIRQGYIGPGPSCFVIAIKEDFKHHVPSAKDQLYTSICNITHSPKIENVQSEEHTTYFGFGNYFKLKKNSNNTAYTLADGSSNMIVFDGDIYITPHEITTLYKTYNFESADTLQSTQITNYIPLESKVNTYFDYGQNLRNTNSANLIYEPGQIEGIMTQERPAHQYNMIYSDNDASNDVFTLISTDENETNKFPQRTYFSEPKTNGEFIDNFLIFKPASFIDVEGTYGQITELATNKNILYYWQEHAFGKFSVNERSLINDTNGNTIMLGQAGILSRYDYIDTRYGMREGDRCECPVDDMVYWIDINNKAVVAGNTQQAINYGERLGVQNIINDKIYTDRPYVHHDLQNDELLCKCLEDREQVVFNTKYNIATSVYTRNYIDILNVKNHLYGIHIDKDSKLNITKYNYLDNYECSYLTPMALFFVVNPNASITKVFDSQQIVPIKRNFGNIDKLKLTFETDLYDKVIADNTDRYTDREGNIIYNVPRWGNEAYGNRIRGKWMKVGMELEEPNINNYSCLSHVITKFRQSFS